MEQKKIPVILIVEDEFEIADILEKYLKSSGFHCVVAHNGIQALQLFKKNRPDIILLDIRMPIKDGWQVLRELRIDSEVPIVILTAYAQDDSLLKALQMGADDFIAKPFNPQVVVAKCKTVLKRSNASTSLEDFISIGRLTLLKTDYSAYIDFHESKVAIDLTLTEFKIVITLGQSKSRVFTRDEIISLCIPESDALERTVDSHISKLRKKFERLGITDSISSVRGIGYKVGTMT